MSQKLGKWEKIGRPPVTIETIPLISAGSRPKNILVVEDNDLNLKLLTDILEHSGYFVLSTTSGQQAIHLAGLHGPDLILLDIQLPDISGMEVASRLKRDERTRGIPIVAITAFAMSGDRAKFLASGCDDYLSKPYKIAELRTLVQTYTGEAARDGACN